MPTAARLIAALTFCAVGFFAAEVYVPGLAEMHRKPWLTPVCAVSGLLCGWHIMGPLAGRGRVPSMATGLRTSLALMAATLLFLSVWQMLQLALRRRYDGVTEAVLGVMGLLATYGTALMRSDPLIVLIAGGLLGGLFAEWAARRWS